MKVKETYNKGCEHCGATGFVKHYITVNTLEPSLTNVCPVCKGAGIVLVTREYEVPDPPKHQIASQSEMRHYLILGAEINPYDLNSSKKLRKKR